MTLRLCGVLSCAVLLGACGAPSSTNEFQVSWDESNRAFLATEQTLEEISQLSEQRDVWLVRENLSIPFVMRGREEGVASEALTPGAKFDLRVRLPSGEFTEALGSVEIVEALSNLELALVGYRLRNSNSLKCLVSRGPNNDSPVRQVPCAGYNDQNWNQGWITPSQVRFVNNSTRKCILARTTGPAARKAVQSTCANYADQAWLFIPFSPQPTHFQLRNVADTGRCLAVIGHTNETQAIVAGCNARYRDQIWYWY
jgi:hypothetical protein